MQNANQLITLPKRSVDKLRCSRCTEYLSVPPVDLTRKVCGRCNTNGVGCEAYQEIAQYVLFPCIYSKCNEKIAWGKVKEHEMKCLHKTCMCPVKGCSKVYEISSFSLHFVTHHKNLYFKQGPLIINPTNDLTKNKQVFLLDGEQLFLIFVYGVPESYNSNPRYYGRQYTNAPQCPMQYYFGVFALNSDFDNKIKFEVTLTAYTNSQLVSYSQKNQNIIPFVKRDHCFKCIGTNCAATNNHNGTNFLSRDGTDCTATYYHKQGNNFLPVNFNRVDMENCTKVSYQIDIKQGEEREENADNHELAKKMECRICTRYMVSPIYICDTGHSFCKDCKQKLSICPFCQAHIGDKRNFILEELAETIKVNCNNVKYGCGFFGGLKSVQNHEDVCTYTVPK